MQLQLRVLVIGQDGKRRVAGTGTNFQHRNWTGIFCSNLVKYGKLLLQPFAVLEEVGCVVFIKQVPPLSRVRIESTYDCAG